MRKTSLLVAVLGLVAGASRVALAVDGPPGGGGQGGPPAPPPEAIQACSGKAEKDSCNFQGHGHTVEGMCRTGPDSTTLACAPAHPHGPPPEAITACTGKAENDACSVELGGQTHDGTCAKGREGNGPLACRPAKPPPPPP